MGRQIDGNRRPDQAESASNEFTAGKTICASGNSALIETTLSSNLVLYSNTIKLTSSKQPFFSLSEELSHFSSKRGAQPKVINEVVFAKGNVEKGGGNEVREYREAEEEELYQSHCMETETDFGSTEESPNTYIAVTEDDDDDVVE
ncbi:hypothetical protein ACJIZ3_017457 [Penstemon smallii]|uniref:Uncharacterized protein n=1 Tax=Penstemon smallii TaxID=265156 RepID=A0ABD3SWD5_9LAMI